MKISTEVLNLVKLFKNVYQKFQEAIEKFISGQSESVKPGKKWDGQVASAVTRVIFFNFMNYNPKSDGLFIPDCFAESPTYRKEVHGLLGKCKDKDEFFTRFNLISHLGTIVRDHIKYYKKFDGTDLKSTVIAHFNGKKYVRLIYQNPSPRGKKFEKYIDIPFAIYQKLKKKISDADDSEINECIFSVYSFFQIFGPHSMHLGFGPEILIPIQNLFENNIVETFSTSINSNFDYFCSLFYLLEKKYFRGVLPQFFSESLADEVKKKLPDHGVRGIYVNPPYDETVMFKTVEQINNIMKNLNADIAIVGLPNWTEFDAIDLIKKNSLLYKEITGKISFIDHISGERIIPCEVSTFIIGRKKFKNIMDKIVVLFQEHTH